MALVKEDRSVRRRHYWDMLLGGVPFAGCVLAAIWGYIPQKHFAWLMPVLFSVAVIGYIRQWQRLHRFICPSCGSKIKRERVPPGSPIVFSCPQCQTDWDTGVVECEFDGGDG